MPAAIFVTVPDFTAALPQGVSYGFFTRAGGVSSGLLDSLNIGFGTKDSPENVAENRARVVKALGGDYLTTLYQTHSADVHAAETLQDCKSEGDALVTAKAGQVIGVLTADCVPVLLAGMKDAKPVVAAVHAGWGGTAKGIVVETIFKMKQDGVNEIVACIGPCIRQASYEVGADLKDRFTALDKRWNAAFAHGKADGKYQFDLPFIVRSQLEDQHLRGVFDCDLDTYPDTARFFSYRRTTHAGEDDYGRQISAITINQG
jgi:YfiH family protein